MGDQQIESLANEILGLMEDFKLNHDKAVEKGNKSAARRARKFLSDAKKLVTPYRKASMDYVAEL